MAADVNSENNELRENSAADLANISRNILSGARFREAKFQAKFGGFAKILATFLSIILIFFGAILLIDSRSFGWIILTFASWPLMFLIWQNQQLKVLPPTKLSRNSANNLENDSRKIADILAGDVLGLLPENPSPRDFANAVLQTNGGRFFVARFGISSQFLPELVSENPDDVAKVWAETLSIYDNLTEKSDTISAAILTAALLRTSDAARETLGTLHLDADDLTHGAEWFSHLENLIREQNSTHLTGGIARDWSFGYVPTLEHFGVDISSKYSRGASRFAKLESHAELLAQMAERLSSARSNVALIAPVGAGKSTVVESFAARLMDGGAKIPDKLKFNQVFALDAASLISAASGRGQLENLVNQLFNEAYKAKNIIIFLDNAELFFAGSADAVGSVDLANLLQPILENGALKIILALDEQKFLEISQNKPALAAALNRLPLGEISRNDVIKVLEDQLISLEFSRNVTFMYQSLNEVFRLSERYLHDVAQPGRAVQLLTDAANFASDGLVTEQSVRDAIEQTLGVKVAGDVGANDAGEREKLLNLENLIHERMIDQTAAVTAVSAALRRARAGVRNENRPIGTFLFLGPTGVGKTELAKSLAAVYFGGEDHLVRIDLNEFVSADDVARLIADGATDPNSLAAQVEKNPFSVVLLDEIEKAHPNVLTTLLQLLDEGILRDIKNREISFRDAIVVATSNAGAERIREYIDAGYKVEQFSDKFQDELISSRIFAPEFLNRFDEIIIFRPLEKPELLQIVDLIIAGINKNLANQKVAVAVDDDAKKLLVDMGYDPRLGARPLRRVVQKTVENIVAQKLLSGELVAGSGLKITLADLQNDETFANKNLVNE